MDDVQKLGNLLELPNLEAETIKLVNEKMRELIGGAKVQKPLDTTDSLYIEWTEGKREGE